ncbi:MAG: cell surface protein SprA, partial [Bacteroidetes bacterium]
MHNRVDNYLLSERLRKTTQFDFDQKIQMNVQATVGDRVKFGMNYDTESTFDFDKQNIKLGYEGKEDDWLKSIDVGNVSMNLNSALIPGASSLFGIKSNMQFGKLKVSALASQQRSSVQNVSTKGGIQKVKFDIPIDQYDANRHFFLAQYFRDTYDKNMLQLPYITSGITINRIEVWVTNKRAQFEQARNILAFTDLGEVAKKNNNYWTTTSPDPIPTNTSNSLYNEIKSIPNIRDIQQFVQIMDNPPYNGLGIAGGEDFEKVESARKLDPSEYTLNSTLGFVSLHQSLQPDEVLAVAFEYTYGGKVYRVGEFSTDGINAPEALIVKLLKSTLVVSRSNMWNLMMKNVYSLGASSFTKENFKLNVMHKNDSTGVYLNYINAGNIKNRVLLSVMNLDRLDDYNNAHPDGKFDFVE